MKAIIVDKDHWQEIQQLLADLNYHGYNITIAEIEIPDGILSNAIDYVSISPQYDVCDNPECEICI